MTRSTDMKRSRDEFRFHAAKQNLRYIVSHKPICVVGASQKSRFSLPSEVLHCSISYAKHWALPVYAQAEDVN